MCDWLTQVGEVLRSIRASMRLELLSGDYIQQCLASSQAKALIHTFFGEREVAKVPDIPSDTPALPIKKVGVVGAGTRGSVVFDFKMGRSREGPRKFLGNYDGDFTDRRTDGYSAYDQVRGAKVIRAECWSHVRRKFFQAFQVDPQEKRALELVAAIDELFSIEALAREGGVDAPQRLALLQVEAGPWLEKILWLWKPEKPRCHASA